MVLVGEIISADPSITQGIFLTMMAILSGADMEPIVGAGDIVLVSDYHQFGLGFSQLEKGDIIAVQQRQVGAEGGGGGGGGEGSRYYRHYVSQVVDIIENQSFNIGGETHYRDLLVVQGMQDPNNPLDDYESVQDADWTQDWRIVHPVEFEGVVIDVIEGAAHEYVGEHQQEQPEQQQPEQPSPPQEADQAQQQQKHQK